MSTQQPSIPLPAIDMRALVKSGAHFGHRRRFWHPSFKKYIYGVRNDLHIINLDETKHGLIQAARFCSAVAASGKQVLFVCTKSAGSEATKFEAERCGMSYVNHRWLGGLLSNYDTVLKSVRKLEEYEQQSKSENLRNMTKKEGLRLLNKLRRLQLNLSGVRNMNGLPAALFMIDAGHHHIAVKEAHRIGIPVIAVVDSNYSTDGIDVVIPGNDDSSHAINIYLRVIADAIVAGKATITAAPQAAQDKPATTKTS